MARLSGWSAVHGAHRIFDANILVPGNGWRLSGACDMNPVFESHGLNLNVGESDNAIDLYLDLARLVAPYLRVTKKQADEIVECSQAVVKQWPIANYLHIRVRKQERTASAFGLAG